MDGSVGMRVDAVLMVVVIRETQVNEIKKTFPRSGIFMKLNMTKTISILKMQRTFVIDVA